MKKETFIKAIESLEKQIKYDIEVSKNLEKVFPDAFSVNLLPKNHFLSNALLEVLQEEMNDTDNWIEHFCYELNFGGENWRLKVYDKDKNEIPLSTPIDLWNLLNHALQHTK